jgi:hypothetical protein
MRPRRLDLGPLRERNYRLLWLGRSSSMLGDSLGFVAMAFAVLALNGSGTDLGLVVMTFLGVERHVPARRRGRGRSAARRLVMIGADVVRGLAQVGLAVAVLTDTARCRLFILVAFLAGSATASSSRHRPGSCRRR